MGMNILFFTYLIKKIKIYPNNTSSKLFTWMIHNTTLSSEKSVFPK